jgi:glycosyltransferase involved in cell wall biosynthesis
MEYMENPYVSILMTSYNRAAFIGNAIESALGSSFANFELIVCDDNSSDDTVEIAKAYAKLDNRIKVFVNEKNLGDYPNRNKAASYAKGKYIKYLDADDMLYYFGLDVAVKFTESFPEAGFGLGAYPDDNNPFPILVTPRDIYLEHFYKYSHFDRSAASGLIKLDVFNAVGGFSGKRMIGDYEFWFKIARYYSMVKYPIDTYWNRLHNEQESKTIYAKQNYPRLREEIKSQALSHPDCPLTSEDILSLNVYLKKEKAKENIIVGLSRLKRIFSFSKR